MKILPRFEFEALPRPVDDGLCDHLTGMAMPSLQLPPTARVARSLDRLHGTCVLYL